MYGVTDTIRIWVTNKNNHNKIENIVYLTSYKHIHTYKVWWDS